MTEKKTKGLRMDEYRITDEKVERLLAEAMLMLRGDTILLPTSAHLLALHVWHEARMRAAEKRGLFFDVGLFP